jgi:hypothetical protein
MLFTVNSVECSQNIINAQIFTTIHIPILICFVFAVTHIALIISAAIVNNLCAVTVPTIPLLTPPFVFFVHPTTFRMFILTVFR